MPRTVVIDCFPECVPAYGAGYAVVAVDVIRATTTVVTAIALGRRCYPVPTVETAWATAAALTDPLLAGELGGDTPDGFEMTNSPALLVDRIDVERPLVLLSTSGTRVICAAEAADAVYIACLRNYRTQAAHLIATDEHANVAVIGAGSRGEFREEDQLCCAWIAAELIDAGYEPADAQTATIVERWRGVPVASIVDGASARYLARSGQLHDLDFVLEHVDDLEDVYRFDGGQVVSLHADLVLR